MLLMCIITKGSLLEIETSLSKVYSMVHRYPLMLLLYRKGDLDELSKHGSLHQYLLHLHKNGHQPIAAFWWGQQRMVSICSPEMFKDTIKLTNRPSKIFHVHT